MSDKIMWEPLLLALAGLMLISTSAPIWFPLIGLPVDKANFYVLSIYGSLGWLWVVVSIFIRMRKKLK